MKTATFIKKCGPTIMGILNLTPDSFSDGGKFHTLKKALKQAKKLEEEGADIIDIGGESTGPGSKNVPLSEELKRVIPILKEIRKNTRLPISIDTYKSKVAEEALNNGADIINDVTALRGDKNMPKVAAKYNCPVIIMFSKDNTPRTTVKNKHYKDITKTIIEFFDKQVNIAQKAGIKKSQIIIDPGMGQFISAIPKYSYEIITNLQTLKKFKLPILLGISRKSLLGGKPENRLDRGLPLSGIAYLNGASILRTHDVEQTVEFFKNFNGKNA